jgi:hypothetical protein
MTLPSVEELLQKDLFELLGVENADESKKKELLETMMRAVDARVLNRVAELLTSKEVEKFNELAETGDPQELADFLVEQEIDLPQIVSEEATKYRIEAVQLIKLAENK